MKQDNQQKNSGQCSSHSDSNIVTFVADITGNKVDPVFLAIKWGQVKDNEETITIQSQTIEQGQKLPKS